MPVFDASRNQLVVAMGLRLDGGPSLVNEQRLENTEWSLLHAPGKADALGASEVCHECLRDEVPNSRWLPT